MSGGDHITVLLIGDSSAEVERTAGMLSREPGFLLVGSDDDLTQGLAKVAALKPDLVFLDRSSLEEHDFASLDTLRKNYASPFLIFAAPYDRYALRALSLHALDYILKPFDLVRLREALAWARRQIETKRRAESGSSLYEMSSSRHSYLDRVMVRTAGHISIVKVDAIDWIEAQGDYLCLHSAGKRHLIRETISRFALKMPPAAFVRIHRSAIVNIDRIREIQPLNHGECAVILHDGTRLTMSRSFRDTVFQRFALSA